MTLKWLSSYAPVDEEFDKVSLLLQGDGTNGSTTIVDSSSSPKAVTALGDAQISTAQSKFGGASIAFDGTGDQISISASTDFQFGTGDFTIEGWCYLLSAPTTGYPDLYRDTAGGRFINFRQSAVFAATTASAIIASSPSGASINEWFHYAVTRSGNTFRVFLNGVSGTPGTFNGPWNTTGVVEVGGGNTEQLHGYIDDLRITKGVARYTQNFTPPTAPFPDLSPSGRVTIEDNSLDVDARQYIINVEEQDGQPLESGVRTAINDFVVGCKADGIWDAIKASCILAGARTLDGALVPLVGGAPTNFNFVSGDYNRETGLVGDGSTKYLDSNRAGNSNPQNNNHLAVYGTSFPSTFSYYAGLLNYHFGWNASAIFSRNNSTSTGFGVAISSANLVGITRSSSTSFVTRAAGSSSSAAVVSIAPDARSASIFASNNNAGPSDFSSARLSFYSIGESLDLALLDTRVSNLMTAIGGAI